MRTPRSRRGILEQTTAAGARGKPDWAPRRPILSRSSLALGSTT